MLPNLGRGADTGAVSVSGVRSAGPNGTRSDAGESLVLRKWRRLVSWFPVALCMLVIFALSATPDLRFAQDPSTDYLVRKAGHAGIFGLLAIASWNALAQTTAVSRPWAWAVLIAALDAVTDELHQGFVAGRHPAVSDVAIDLAGSLLFIAAGLVVVRFVAHRRQGTLPRR